MQAFQDLIASKNIDISYLTTHVFRLEDVHKAYDMSLETALINVKALRTFKLGDFPVIDWSHKTIKIDKNINLFFKK